MSDNDSREKKERREERERMRQERMRLRDERAFRMVPITVQGMDAYVSEAPTKWEKLARLWEVESKMANRRGDQSTPEPIGKERWRQFWKIWEGQEA